MAGMKPSSFLKRLLIAVGVVLALYVLALLIMRYVFGVGIMWHGKYL
jgi:hypothetical protein